MWGIQSNRNMSIRAVGRNRSNVKQVAGARDEKRKYWFGMKVTFDPELIEILRRFPKSEREDYKRKTREMNQI